MIKLVRNFLDNLKLNARFNLFISIQLVIIFSFLGYYLYIAQKQDIFKNSDKQLRVLLDDLINIFEVQTNLKQKNVESTMKFAVSFFYQMNGIKTDSSYVDIEQKDINNATRSIKIKKWIFNNVPLHTNYDFVDFIKGGGVDCASVFQRTAEGFVRISTNVLNPDSTRAIGSLLSPTSVVSKNVIEGKRYTGRVYIINEWYLASYEPIFIDGKVEGLLEIAVHQIDYDVIKPLFYSKTYFQSGYPYVVSGEGISIVNPNPQIEGHDQKGTKFFHSMEVCKENNEERFRYKWPEDDTGVWKWTYLKYYEPLDIYIATSLYEYELYTGLTKIRNGIIFGICISIVVFFIGISFIIRPMTNWIQKLVGIISLMSNGKIVDKIYYPRKDEIGDIILSLNTLIKGLSDTAIFANEIGQGDFGSHFIPLSKQDTLGNSLLNMRKSLKKAKDEEEKRKLEDQKRNWTSEGLAVFNDILRKSSDNINELSADIIHSLIKYLKANQGGLFIYNDTDPQQPYFELIAAYAYDRQKYLQKRISMGEGLVGTCAIELETIYLSEIPEDYVEIESGLGTSNPSFLLLVPMKLDNRIFGVLEIASFHGFDEHEISFVEKLGENIASTLSTAQMSVRTIQLLKESRKQSEALATKEEEMRLNLIELQSTQEEFAKRQAEMSGVLAALDSSFLVSELDLHGDIIAMNDSFMDLLQITEREIIGKRETDLISMDDEEKSKYTNFWAEVRQSSNSLKIQTRCMSGAKEVWLSETYTPICDNNGRAYKVLNIAIDITQSKKQEFEIQKLLEESRRKTQRLSKQEKLNTFNVEKLEKTQAESARKEAELKSVLDAIDNTALRGEYQTDGTILFANERYLKLLGYVDKEMIGQNNKIFIPADEMQEFEDIWFRINNGQAYTGIVKRKTKSQQDVWLLMSYTPIKAKNNTILRILFLAHDITSLKNSEYRVQEQSRKLIEKQRQLKQQIEVMNHLQLELENSKSEMDAFFSILNSSSAVMYLDLKGKIIYCNDLAIKELKLDSEKIIGRRYVDVLQLKAECREEFLKIWERVVAGETVQEKNNIEKDGKQLITTENFIPVVDKDGIIYKILHIYTHVEMIE